MKQRGFLTERAIVWLVSIALCAVAWGGLAVLKHHYDENRREEGREQLRAEWTRQVDAENRRQAALEVERRRKQLENDHATATALAAAAADAAGARAAADRLRVQLAAFVAARRDPGQAQPAAGLGPRVQGADPLDLLADLFSRADDTAGELAGYADALRAAGQRCERGYDAEVIP